MTDTNTFEPVVSAPERSPDDRWLPVQGNRVLFVDGLAGPRPLTGDEADQLTDEFVATIVIGRVEGESGHWFTARLRDDFDPFDQPVDGLILADLRSVMGKLEPLEWNIAGRATQLCDWHRDNTRCGRCGTAMVMGDTERVLKCPDDGYSAYPRLSPAVIVLVEHPDGRALLARNVAWPMAMYSTLAGFVEPGESLEDTIHREILEEVGLDVTDIRYFDSQPWPFPNSLMLGFFATWAGGEITPQPDEIADAQWFSRDDLPMIPPPASIARQLIDDWLRRS